MLDVSTGKFTPVIKPAVMQTQDAMILFINFTIIWLLQLLFIVFPNFFV